MINDYSSQQIKFLKPISLYTLNFWMVKKSYPVSLILIPRIHDQIRKLLTNHVPVKHGVTPAPREVPAHHGWGSVYVKFAQDTLQPVDWNVHSSLRQHPGFEELYIAILVSWHLLIIIMF